ncbi:MAG: DUF3786 domain-containing protein [Desulfobacterales bacterium]|jgi:hypothetical protein
MTTPDGNYARIVADNLARLYDDRPADLARRLCARQEENRFFFSAFGRACVVCPEAVRLDGRIESGVLGILISLYARFAQADPCVLEPLKGFKELPDSMPYAGAFVARTQQVLVTHVERIQRRRDRIAAQFACGDAPPGVSGDFALLLYPLPKIALCYVFYLADEDFPASVTCLYSANAAVHMPTDALADVGEYTSQAILRIVGR